jgi:hypothetical protein
MKYLTILLISLFTISLTSCGGCFGSKNKITISTDSDDKEDKKSNNPFAEAQKALEDIADGKQIEPVNFRELQKGLDEKVRGYERTDMSGETSGTMGFTISQAEATYTKDEDNIIEVSVVDAGGISMAIMGLAAWSMAKIDKEDSNGYERTGSFMGYKSYEKYDKRRNRSEIALIIEERIIFTANGSDIEMKDLKRFVESLGVKKFGTVI